MYVIAAIAYPPQSTCFQLVPPANVVTGVDLEIIVLSPSDPKLLYPQSHKVPSVLIAILLKVPSETCFQLVPPANVVTGMDLLIIVLSPICPKPFCP